MTGSPIEDLGDDRQRTEVLRKLRMTMKKYDRAFWALFSVLLLARLLTIGRVELFSDEAYYWLQSKFPAACYQFNPPVYSYLIAFFTLLFGDTLWGVRLMSLASWVGLTIVFYLFARDISGRRAAFYSVLVINLLPVFIPVGFITIPDMPFLFFWMLAVFFLWKIFGKDSPSPYLWYAAGASIGLGLMSKYFMVLMMPCVFLYLVLSPKNRQWLKKKEPYLAALLSFVIMSPAIYWNFATKLESMQMHFKGRHAVETIHLISSKFTYYLVSQSVIVTPIVFLLVLAAMAYAVYAGLKRKEEDLLFLAFTSAPVLVFFAGWALFVKVKPHWTCYCYLTAVILMVMLMERSYASAKSRSARFLLLLPFGVTFIPLLLTLLVVFSAATGCLKYFPLPADVKSYLYVRFDYIPDRWTQTGRYIREVYEGLEKGSKGVFLFGTKEYVTISLAAYYAGKPMQSYLLEPEILAEQFLYWQKPERMKKLEGFDAVAVGKTFHFEDFDFRKYFSRVEEAKPVEFMSKGKLKKTVLVYRCYGFKPLP